MAETWKKILLEGEVVTLGDSSQLATSAAPTADADIANKKYVDDNAGGEGGAADAIMWAVLLGSSGKTVAGAVAGGDAISVEDTPTDGQTTTAISSNWAFDHNAKAATASVQGHATAAQITKLDGIEASLKTYFDGLYNLYSHPNHSGDVTSVADGAQTIANKQTVTATAPVTISNTPTVIAAAAPVIAIPAATATVDGYATSTQITKLDGIEAGAEANNISDTNATDLTDGGVTTLHKHSTLTSGKIPIASTGGVLIDGQTPLAGTNSFYVKDGENQGNVYLTFINGILTAAVAD